ncbi:hypothetical protein [Paenibacillus sp. ISL-20]|uniref:hypothetical protein n=1 Tax=Paenibacillus sp. ISL-20 TaxID=2819163 RepID=UPI001BE5B49C|nr:hypothetical protein [Paenibacillus sp. ISL-20]MBT2759895.1 hypothetical protein [Paenibacillus sp. ISL-20]
MSDNNPLKLLYGEEALELAVKEIKKLAMNSNFTFDKEYVQTGMSLLAIKAKETLDGKKRKSNLESLVSESFGEAAIFKFQC